MQCEFAFVGGWLDQKESEFLVEFFCGDAHFRCVRITTLCGVRINRCHITKYIWESPYLTGQSVADDVIQPHRKIEHLTG